MGNASSGPKHAMAQPRPRLLSAVFCLARLPTPRTPATLHPRASRSFCLARRFALNRVAKGLACNGSTKMRDAAAADGTGAMPSTYRHSSAASPTRQPPTQCGPAFAGNGSTTTSARAGAQVASTGVAHAGSGGQMVRGGAQTPASWRRPPAIPPFLMCTRARARVPRRICPL